MGKTVAKNLKQSNGVRKLTITIFVILLVVFGLVGWLSISMSGVEKNDDKLNVTRTRAKDLPAHVKDVDATLYETDKSLSQDLDVSDLDQEIDALL